ncbi:MAG: hypothetical protein IE927_12810 [Rhodobacterales bacterium]|nr:hypothetical protein [Rhodobacterales bacterium]
MPTLTLRGDQIGQALQFVENAGITTVEIGRVWFAATDTVRLEIAPGLTDATGAFLGGNGAILSMTVTTVWGQVTTFSTSSDGLDVDPDRSKIGADFFYISESPGRGTGGAYDGLVLEQIVVSHVALARNALVTFVAGGGYQAGTGGGTGGGGGGQAPARAAARPTTTR